MKAEAPHEVEFKDEFKVESNEETLENNLKQLRQLIIKEKKETLEKNTDLLYRSNELKLEFNTFFQSYKDGYKGIHEAAEELQGVITEQDELKLLNEAVLAALNALQKPSEENLIALNAISEKIDKKAINIVTNDGWVFLRSNLDICAAFMLGLTALIILGICLHPTGLSPAIFIGFGFGMLLHSIKIVGKRLKAADSPDKPLYKFSKIMPKMAKFSKHVSNLISLLLPKRVLDARSNPEKNLNLFQPHEKQKVDGRSNKTPSISALSPS